MAKNTKDAYNAQGTTSLLLFDPDLLTLVTDPASRLYDPRVHDPLEESFVQNVEYHGILQAVAVWKNPETGGTEIIQGRQRVKAAREVNRRRRDRGLPEKVLLQVPAMVYRGEIEKILDALISENEARRDDTPIGRAEKMRRLMAAGRGEDQIAVVFNCSVKTVKDTMALLDSPAAVRDAVQAGTVTVAQAKHLSKLDPAEQREKVCELAKAAAEQTGHARAKKQRQVLGTDQPKMRTRAQIAKALDDAQGEYAAALRWVLGEEIKLPGLEAAKDAMNQFEAVAA